MRDPTRILLLVCALLCALCACGDDTPADPDVGSPEDGGHDTDQPDVEGDISTDTSPDDTSDQSPDFTSDLSPDDTSDQSPDFTSDLSPDGVEVPVTLSGAVQKGPFVVLSTVDISPLDTRLQPRGTQFQTHTSSDLGEFEVEVNQWGPVLIEANGFYYNEITGQLSDAPITLRAYYYIGSDAGSDQTAYVNILTHLIMGRVATLYDASSDFPSAVNQAEAELVSALPIGPPDLDLEIDAIETNLLDDDSLASAYLFAVSAVLIEAARQRGGGSVDAVFQELLNTLSIDFADDGEVEAALVAEIQDAQLLLHPDEVMELLQERLDFLGSTEPVPDLNQILDQDFDGAVNTDDCLPLDPDRWTDHADFDEDGVSHWACGGADCDDDCVDCNPAGESTCGASRDHDCDGTIDDVTGCPSGTTGLPHLVGTLDLLAAQLYVEGDTLFCLEQGESNDLSLFDISDPASPTLITTISDMGYRRFAVTGDTLVLDGNSGVQILDIADPMASVDLGPPVVTVLGHGDTSFNSFGHLAAVSGLVVMVGENRVYTMIVDGKYPVVTGLAQITDLDGVTDLVLADGVAWITTSRELIAINLANSSQPTLLGRVLLDSGYSSDSIGLQVSDGTAYVVSDTRGLVVFDVTDPTDMTLIERYEQFDSPYSIRWTQENSNFVAGDEWYVVNREGLHIIDVSDPASAGLLTGFLGPLEEFGPIFVSNGIAWVGPWNGGVYGIDLDYGGLATDLCGDGVLDSDYDEKCDGDDFGGLTCGDLFEEESEINPDAVPGCSSFCELDLDPCFCGNGMRDSEGEECDGEEELVSCHDLGWDGGETTCTANCRIDTSGCTGEAPTCGNGSLEAFEDCDGDLFPEELDSCEEHGFYGGALGCYVDCGFDYSGCEAVPTCGDGVLQEGEQCDGEQWEGGGHPYCSDYGFDDGDVNCNHCRIDTSQCFGGCGDNDINDGEICDGEVFEVGDRTCASIGLGEGIRTCGPDCDVIDESACTGDGEGDTCADVYYCWEDCESSDYDCANDCIDVGSPWAQTLSMNIIDCMVATGCTEHDCIADRCPTELETCLAHCNPTCDSDMEQCVEGVCVPLDCGDGDLDEGEQCDAGEFDPEYDSCGDFGFEGGEVSCVADYCLVDTAGCFTDPGPAVWGPVCALGTRDDGVVTARLTIGPTHYSTSNDTLRARLRLGAQWRPTVEVVE